jgi:1-acyl-sn-glycerol-3-phosphate acyltransferase
VPLRLALRLACRVRGIGTEHIPLDGGAIVAANHTSFADPVVLQAFCPRHLTFLMIDRYYDAPALNGFVRFWGCIRIREGRPNRDALRQAVAVLREGRAVGIFPEGGISRDGHVHEARPGVGLLAERAEVPLVPVGLAGVQRFLPPDTWTFHRSTITIVVGEPFRADGLGRRELAQRLTSAIRDCARSAEAASKLRQGRGHTDKQ